MMCKIKKELSIQIRNLHRQPVKIAIRLICHTYKTRQQYSYCFVYVFTTVVPALLIVSVKVSPDNTRVLDSPLTVIVIVLLLYDHVPEAVSSRFPDIVADSVNVLSDLNSYIVVVKLVTGKEIPPTVDDVSFQDPTGPESLSAEGLLHATNPAIANARIR